MVGMYTFIEGVLVWRLLGDFDAGEHYYQPTFRMLMIRRNGEGTNERQNLHNYIIR